MNTISAEPYHAFIGTAFGCDAELARTIAALARPGAMTRGQLLYPLDDRDETSLVVEGQAQEAAYGRDGDVLVFHRLGPGEFYGKLFGLGDGEAQVEGVTAGRTLHYGSEAVVQLMECYTCVALAITRQLAARLAALRQRMVETSLLSATGRICAELQRLARQAPDGAIRPLPVFSELAQRVKSTRETVSRTVSQLEKRGILKREDGGLTVVAPHRLDELIY